MPSSVNINHKDFNSALQRVIDSKGKEALPNVSEILDPREALTLIGQAHGSMMKPYIFRTVSYDPPLSSGQTHEIAYYPKIFLNVGGMASQFDGSGIILCSGGHAYRFHMCQHEWNTSGANHNRGWHPQRCTKCGFDASIDSGD